MSIAALGVFPYITSSIVMQLLVPIIPRLQQLSKEGEQGRQQINRIVHWATVPPCHSHGPRLRPAAPAPQRRRPRQHRPLRRCLPAHRSRRTINDRWSHVPRLARRAHHRTGYRQRHFSDYLCRHRGRIPQPHPQGFLANNDQGGLIIFAIIGVLIIALIVVFNEAHGESLSNTGVVFFDPGGCIDRP